MQTETQFFCNYFRKKKGMSSLLNTEKDGKTTGKTKVVLTYGLKKYR